MNVETDKTANSYYGYCLEFLRKSKHPVTEALKVCRTPQKGCKPDSEKGRYYSSLVGRVASKNDKEEMPSCEVMLKKKEKKKKGENVLFGPRRVVLRPDAIWLSQNAREHSVQRLARFRRRFSPSRIPNAAGWPEGE